MKEKQIKRVIDAGITDIYLEEPEFWMRGGYSNAFKEEWMNAEFNLQMQQNSD